ncbi:hypothetical protein KKI24_05795 [bacterium]|nr:hypothetical protein [bacterium]
MKRLILITSILVFIQGTIWAQELCSGTACMPQEVQSECTTMQSNGCIDWSNGIVYATGMGVPNPDFKSQAQRTYSAYEAAKTVAMRNLLQMVEGINISSTKTVKAGMLENDTINTQISGRIRNVIEAGRPKTMSDGSIWVTMKMYLRDIMSILVNNQQFELQDEPSSQPAVPAKPVDQEEKKTGVAYGGKSDTVYTGLIIDARGTAVTPAMSPKVYNQEGKEIYGSAAVERDFVLQHGIVGYMKDLDKAMQNQRVQGNPLIIKATSSEKATDLTITNEDAALLEALDATQSFLREARVLIIIG